MPKSKRSRHSDARASDDEESSDASSRLYRDTDSQPSSSVDFCYCLQLQRRRRGEKAEEEQIEEVAKA